jgi:hypothetical protein
MLLRPVKPITVRINVGTDRSCNNHTEGTLHTRRLTIVQHDTSCECFFFIFRKLGRNWTELSENSVVRRRLTM